MRSVIACAESLAVVAGPGSAWAEAGGSPKAIVFDQAAILQGLASVLGLGMTSWLLGGASRQRGAQRHQIRLISVDGVYEPSNSIAATRRLIEVDKSLALIGAGATPTAVAARPIAVAAKVPFIAASTDATVPPKPERDSVIDSRASRNAEAGGAFGMGGLTMIGRTARARRWAG